jgi:hypothetical protein
MSETIQQPAPTAPVKEHPSIAFLKAAQRNIFKTRKEADKFLKTPAAKEMILWVVRKGGKHPCFMVDTPERIKVEKANHKSYSKLDKGQKGLAIMFEVMMKMVVAGALAVGFNQKKRVENLKAQYAVALEIIKKRGAVEYLSAEKAGEVFDLLSGIDFKDCQVHAMGNDICVWLLNIRNKSSIRKDLDLFSVKLTIYLSHDRKKVRHLGFGIYDAKKLPPPGEYGFIPGSTLRNARIEVSGKTGGSGAKLAIGRLTRALKGANETPRPSQHIRNLYALTSIPNLRKVIPPVEDFLRLLYPTLFKHEDYRDWGIRRVKKVLDEVENMSQTLDFPEEKPLAVGVDETARVLQALIKALRGWHKQLKKANQK